MKAISVKHYWCKEYGDIYELQEKIHYLNLHIPSGFVSDGCSVPRFFWRVVFPKGDTRAMRAGFVHDYIYRNHPEKWTREEADVNFLNILIADGINKVSAYIAFFGVRLFGKKSWNAKGGNIEQFFNDNFKKNTKRKRNPK